jgi:hypothetical protein
LQFKKQDILGQNIKNLIIPKIIAEIHDDLVIRYLDTSISRAIGKERFVLPIDKQGYMVPSILMIKILPNLEKGLQFIGFIKERDVSYCFPYS